MVSIHVSLSGLVQRVYKQHIENSIFCLTVNAVKTCFARKLSETAKE